MTAGPRMNAIVFHTMLAVLSVLFALPFLWMVSTSFKADDEAIHKPPMDPRTSDARRESPYLDMDPPLWEHPQAFPTRPIGKRSRSGCEAFRSRADEISGAKNGRAPSNAGTFSSLKR
jgi:ABC-type glycerol-3-phosphate transport system permease component